MNSIRIYSFDPKSWFMGVIKSFDTSKGFGYIASNNCGIRVATYDQEFYINSDSFYDSSCISEGTVVVFQLEYLKNDKKRAINVRPFSNTQKNDILLALNYLGSHEMIQVNGSMKNMLIMCEISRKYLLPKLKDIILKNHNRDTSLTVDTIAKFISCSFTPNTDLQNRSYIFTKDFSSDELRQYWSDLFSILSVNEWIAFLNEFPMAVIYADESTVNEWINKLIPQIDSDEAYKDFQCTLPLLSESLRQLYSAKWANYAEAEFLETLNQFKIRACIPGNSYGEDNKLDDAIVKLRRYSDRNFEKEIRNCYCEIKVVQFRSTLQNFSEASGNWNVRNALKKLFLDLDHQTNYITEVADTFNKLINYNLSSENLGYVFELIKFATELNVELGSHLIREFDPIIQDTLQVVLTKAVENDSSSYFKNIFEPAFKTYTSLCDKENVVHLKEQFSQQIKNSKSYYTLFCAADSELHWIEVDDAKEIAADLINHWTDDDIIKGLNSTIDSRVVTNVFKRAIELLWPKQTDTDKQHKISDQTINILHRLNSIEKDDLCKSIWHEYLGTLSTENLIILYVRGVIDLIPNNAIKEILNKITLNDTYNKPCGWYSAPAFRDERIKHILANPNYDLFNPISDILKSANIDKDNLALYVWLTEILAFNKPSDLDNRCELSWNQNFKSKLTQLRNSLPNDSLIIPILWAVYMETRCSKALLAEIFPLLPPYLQIKVVKRLFRFVSTGEMKFTAKSMYNFISHGEQLCLAVEILFSYLTLREDDNTANFNNTHMLKLIDGREDHSEWIGIREFLEQCHGRWSIERDNLSSCKEQLFNGFLFMDEKINKICLFISKRMVNINYDVQKYNNKFYATINELIALNFSPSDYSTVLKSDSIEYYFKSECLRNLILLIKPFKIYYSKLSNIKFSCDNNQEDFFCECRLADSLNTAYELPFFWCSNRLCFRSAVRFHTDQEWEDYTVLDFMRILNIPIDYKNKMGKKTPKGYFIIFSGMMKKFAKFYEHMKCRKCSHLLKPKGITNFAKQAITEFCCANDTCENYNKLIYLNTCFNSKNCGEIIDSRDTLQCPNGQYICPNCGACCSNEIFERRISNLKETGGYITQRLLSLANGKYGHWEKGEFYCYKCGDKMNTDVCQNCGSTYLKTK